MPTCKKCNEKFPCRIRIDGQEKNIAGRKYCLDCSPFGKHNTVSLHKRPDGTPTCEGKPSICTKCGREYIYRRKSGHTVERCNSCMANARCVTLKKRMVEYKGGECTCCGYNRCLRALEFHHRDPKTKKFCVSGAHCRKWSAIEKELDKCDIVCSNCHKEIEAGIKTK